MVLGYRTPSRSRLRFFCSWVYQDAVRQIPSTNVHQTSLSLVIDPVFRVQSFWCVASIECLFPSASYGTKCRIHDFSFDIHMWRQRKYRNMAVCTSCTMYMQYTVLLPVSRSELNRWRGYQPTNPAVEGSRDLLCHCICIQCQQSS